MSDNRLQQIKEGWNATADSEWYRSLRTEEKIAELVKDPASAFHPTVWALLEQYLPDLRDKKILVPSSGDNHAAIAFALCGADVTSADISERQLEHASAIARKLGLSMTFICEDTMQLSRMEDEAFDLVYTSNGTHTWIPDLSSMYSNIYRVLKQDGYSVMYDIHPFQRPFTGEPWQKPMLRKAYAETMPDCHWRVQDLVNAMAHAGLTVEEMAELPAADESFWYSFEERKTLNPKDTDGLNDWKRNPMAALPAWISIVCRKEDNDVSAYKQAKQSYVKDPKTYTLQEVEQTLRGSHS